MADSGVLQRRRRRRLGIYGRFAALEERRRGLGWFRLLSVRSHVGSPSVANRNSEDRSDGGGATSATQHGAIPLPSCPIYSAGHRRLGDRRDETKAQTQISAPDVEQTASIDRAGYPFSAIRIESGLPNPSPAALPFSLASSSLQCHPSPIAPPPYKFPAIRSPPFISD